MKPWVKRGLAIGVAVAVIVGTYVFVLPQFANYGEVWDEVQMLSWEWIAVLFAAVTLNLATFAPPWMAALPGLGYWRAEKVTTASTASTYLAPGWPFRRPKDPRRPAQEFAALTERRAPEVDVRVLAIGETLELEAAG